jgi:hypothetical protein
MSLAIRSQRMKRMERCCVPSESHWSAHPAFPKGGYRLGQTGQPVANHDAHAAVPRFLISINNRLTRRAEDQVRAADPALRAVIAMRRSNILFTGNPIVAVDLAA